MPRVDGSSTTALFERVLSGRIDAETVAWLVEGFEKFDRNDGDLSLERCLRLPTPAQRRREERDHWLRAAAVLVDEPTPSAQAAEVQRRLSAFMSRGPWREWRYLSDPPVTATELQQALFRVAQATGDKPIPGHRQMLRALDADTDSARNVSGQNLELTA